MCVSGVVMGRVGGLLLGVLLIGVLVGCGEGLLVEIEPGEEFCLSFDGKNLAPWVQEAARRGRELSSYRPETGRKKYDDDEDGEGRNLGEAPAVQFSYQVVEGGYMDIDVEVCDPKGKILKKDEKKQAGKIRLKTSKNEGELYNVCMSNKFETKNKKLVDFVLISSWALVTRGEHLYPIEDAVLKIESNVRSLNDEISFIFIQETFHLSTTELTFDRLTYATILEGVALIIVNFWQIRSLKHFFEVKRYL